MGCLAGWPRPLVEALGVGGGRAVCTGGAVKLEDLLTRPPHKSDGGVLDFIGDERGDYCSNFGTQWNMFRSVQLDSMSGTKESHKRFVSETGWSTENLRGKLLLDAGCGAGRFAEVALELGARVVAVD